MAATWSDPLYLPPTNLPTGAELHTFAGVEVGVTVADTDPSALEAMWNPDRSVALSVDDDVPLDAFADLLPEFVAHAATLVDRPTEAALALPSRDVDRARIARAAGLHPHGILAVADLRHDGVGRRGDPATAPPGLQIRAAAPEDAAAFAELWWEQTSYEARLGSLRATPAIRSAVDTEAPDRLAGSGTTLLAVTDDGHVVAVVDAQSPDKFAWAGARTHLDPVSYLAIASTTTAHRGRGAAAAIVAELHRRHRSNGVAASLLHYSVHNPLSIPFWSQQGYRPLMTFFSCPLG